MRRNARVWVLCAIAIVSAVIFAGRLYFLQIVSGEDYLERSLTRTSRTVTVTAPRGEILDRFGRPLVTNRMSFSLVFDATTWDKSRREEVIGELITLCDAAGQEYTDSLPISKTAPFSYTYTAGEDSRDERELRDYIKRRKWDENISADELMSNLVERFDLKGSDKGALRKVCGVLYETEMRGFSKSQPYVFARDVERNLITKIKERSRALPGVMIEVEPIREYNTKAAAHILGRVGIIYSEEYDELKKLGYKLTDMVGKDGIEKAYESYLRGIDGSKTTETTVTGKTTTVLYEEPPILGKNCVLTIDLKMQEAAEAALAETVPRLRREGATNSRWGGADAKGAAVVAIDIKTGGVLVSASYPTYDISQYSKNYNAMKKDKYLPMFNRAVQGAYPPGSTFKMITAVAGLEENIIEPKEKMLTTGKYMYYAPSTTPMCDIFRQYGKTHGEINVSEAIKVSCNYFFYDIGRRLGIETLSSWAEKFGLGGKTGVEISGEVSGQVASSEAREKNGKVWYPGETLSAAIGQSDTMVTPIQLANYVAQLVNRGVRYKPHLLKSVRDPETNEEIESTIPEIVGRVDISEETYNAIIEGMHAGAQEEGGTSYSVFGSYPISVGGKTGSAQAPGGSHAVYVAFAPIENPEVAVAVVVENGGQGSRIPQVAKAVFDAYFSASFEGDNRIKSGVLLA